MGWSMQKNGQKSCASNHTSHTHFQFFVYIHPPTCTPAHMYVYIHTRVPSCAGHLQAPVLRHTHRHVFVLRHHTRMCTHAHLPSSGRNVGNSRGDPVTRGAWLTFSFAFAPERHRTLRPTASSSREVTGSKVFGKGRSWCPVHRPGASGEVGQGTLV